MFRKTDNLWKKVEELEKKVRRLDDRLHKEIECRRYPSVSPETISNIWESLLTRTQVDVGLDKSATVAEVIQALLEYLEVDIVEVQRHLEIKAKKGPGGGYNA